jgi:hypothetical protein
MFMLPKSLAEFASADAKAVQSVFCRDMCVAENTLREVSVELSAFKRTTEAQNAAKPSQKSGFATFLNT